MEKIPFISKLKKKKSTFVKMFSCTLLIPLLCIFVNFQFMYECMLYVDGKIFGDNTGCYVCSYSSVMGSLFNEME